MTAEMYHGRPCKKCGGTVRYASTGHCVPCQRENSKGNLAATRERCRKWRMNNKDRDRERKRAWIENNPEKAKKGWERWRKEHPDKRRQMWQNYKARKLGAKSEYYDFKEIRAKYGNRCIGCGKRGNLTIDHVVPLSLGGSDMKDNIQPLCLSCNCRKGAKFIDYRYGPQFSKAQL